MYEKTMVAGAIPKVMSSASESICTPIGDETCKRRATIPSKKSNTAPSTMNAIASSKLHLKAITHATQPENRLQQVIVLGICFFIDMESLFKCCNNSLVTYRLLVKSYLDVAIKRQIEVDA